MGNTYGYKPLSYELITLLRSGAPDFAAAEDLIRRGADVNDQGDDKGENVLSEILMGYWQSGTDDMAQEECWNCELSRNECAACEHNLNPNVGESMIKVIRFFLNHGFDVNRNDGRHGAQALNSLTLSSFDRYMIDATKMLLDADAKNIPVDEGSDETPMDWIGTEGSYQDTCEHDHALGKTKENILQVDQREPGVVTYDGRIIDGNRRFTCLRLLAKENDKFNYLEAVILDQAVASNTKQIKMLELSIQHGEEGKIDYSPTDILVGLYHDVVETKLLSVVEYARSTNEKPGAVRKKLEIANLMVEYLEFINAPKQFHIIRDLQLYSPLEELSRLLKKCQSDEDAEDLKICVFTNILMRTSSDLGRFIRKFKDVISTPYYEEYIEEQKELATRVLDALPPIGAVNSNTIRDLTKSNSEITQALERSIEKALAKAHKDESQNRPVQILEDVNTLLATLTVDQFDDFSADDFSPVIAQINTAMRTLQKLKEYIGD